MTQSSGRRLPSIRVIIALIGLVMSVPLVVTSWLELNELRHRTGQVEQVNRGIDDLDLLVELSGAVTTEAISILGRMVTEDLLASAPGPSAEQIDLGAGIGATRADSDRILEALADDGLVATVERARSLADGGASAGEVMAAYEEARALLTTSVEDSLISLYGAASSAGGSQELVTSLKVMAATAELQVLAETQSTSWAQLITPGFEPTVGSIRHLSDQVARAEQAAADIERLVEPGSDVAREWVRFRDAPATVAQRERYRVAIVDALAAGPDLAEGELSLTDFEDVDLGVFLTSASIWTTAVENDEVSAQLLDDTAGAAAIAVDAAIADLEDELGSERLGMLVGLGAYALAVVTAWLLLVRLIGVPARRLAEAAQSLRDGQLHSHVDLSGPRELRTAGKAMNEAIGSLLLAERQAVALAEERLDDPVLATEAPGELGASLQTAVARLTERLTAYDELQQQLAHEAAHDGLTRLPNRTAVLRHLSSALARSSRTAMTVALLFIDLDGFKSINDKHGHHIGDIVLRTTAMRLRDTIREGDIAGRLGGDEFVVLGEPVADIEDAVTLARRVLAAISEPITVDGVVITPGGSVGVALSNGDLSADELLRDADLAVYRAKDLGRNRIEVCDEDLRSQMARRVSLEQAIAAAIDNDELLLHYQPVVDGRTGAVTSLEALVRWERPGEGLVPPGAFVPIAERSDLIIEIDRWVLDAVAAQVEVWAGHPTLGRLPLALNISGRHLASGRLVEDVVAVLDRHPGARSRLILEITETAMLEDLPNAARDLARLRAMGISIALDDFGTGYLSLAHLRSLPIDVLKIDRSFVSQLDTSTEHSLVKLIIDTGHLLGVTVTAEGVETDHQLDQLAELGSDSLQGYLFSHPLDPTTLEDRIETGLNLPRGRRQTPPAEPTPTGPQVPADPPR